MTWWHGLGQNESMASGLPRVAEKPLPGDAREAYRATRGHLT